MAATLCPSRGSEYQIPFINLHTYAKPKLETSQCLSSRGFLRAEASASRQEVSREPIIDVLGAHRQSRLGDEQ